MKTYCVMCRKKTKNLKSKIIKTKNGRLIMQSKCADCGIKKSRFVKEQEEKDLLTNLRVKTLLNKIFIVKCFVLRCIKTNEINEIVNNFLLVGDKFMPEMHLKQPGFIYSACGLKERVEKFMQTGNTDFIYQNEPDKASFQHDMAYGKSKALAKRTQSDKSSRDKAFKIAIDPKYDCYQRGLASMVYKFLDESGVVAESSYQLKNELHRRINRKFKRRKVYSSFTDNIRSVDIADMESLSKCNEGIKYLLC